MARRHGHAPQFAVTISDDDRAQAIQSNSGGCLIADAIKRQHPRFTGIRVDMATIRVTDRERGERYTYLTPAPAQHVLLAFDQGWPNPVETVRLERAVKVDKITRSPRDLDAIAARRAARLADLEAKETAATITSRERAALTRIRNAKPAKPRPTSRGPASVDHRGTIHGGAPLVVGDPHPNLLRGRNRHFGAKLADPGQAFREAVEAEVAARLAAETNA